MMAIAALSFIAIYFLKVHFPVIVLGAGLLGLFGGVILPDLFSTVGRKGGRDSDEGSVRICEDPEVCHTNPSAKRNWILIGVFVALWVGPMVLLKLLLSNDSLVTQALFFTKACIFRPSAGPMRRWPTSRRLGWSRTAGCRGRRWIDGLGLAETTPGPLIMVVQVRGIHGRLEPFRELEPHRGRG